VTMPGTPESYHRKRHDGEFETCWSCTRARAICRSKVTYHDRVSAQEAIDRINEEKRYLQPVVRYMCRWCLLWHATTARTKVRVKRAEKQRRKWLRRERETNVQPV